MIGTPYDQSYDDLPYPSAPFWCCHPDHLAVLGRLFGLDPAPAAVETARVLELGCADGGNVIPLAAGLPSARVVAIERSVEQVKTAREVMAASGVDNLEIRCQSFTDIDAELGVFDTIIAHGVYSWVPHDARRHLLRVCAENLAPGGLAYVSFNALPGWSLPLELREMMRYHTAGETDPRRREALALDLLKRLVAAAYAEDDTRRHFLVAELATIQGQEPGYLAHDHLEAENHPVYFHTFMDEARQAGLAYLATAIRELMWWELWPATLLDLFASEKDPVRQQQYLDFVTNARFRAVVLCRADAAKRREPNLDALQSLYVRLPDPSRWVVHPEAESTFGLRGSLNQVVQVDDPGLVAAVAALRAASARALPWAEVVAAAGQPADDLAAYLLRLYFHGAIDLHTRNSLAGPPGLERPRASRLNRVLAERRGWVVDAWHRHWSLDGVDRWVLERLDGTRTCAALVRELRAALGDCGATPSAATSAASTSTAPLEPKSSSTCDSTTVAISNPSAPLTPRRETLATSELRRSLLDGHELDLGAESDGPEQAVAGAVDRLAHWGILLPVTE